MLALDRILLPIDFSERSCGAARYIEALASHFDPQVVLLHVLPPPHYEFGALDVGGGMMSDLAANRAAQVKQELSSFLCRELSQVRVERVLLEGDAARRIVEYAHSAGIRLIVMPTHGYGGFRRFILGSVTAKVLHDADCPIWTGVHLEQAPAVQSIQFREVVAAVDLGPQSVRTLEWASEFARHFGAHLTLVHATPCAHVPADERYQSDWTARMRAQAREQIDKLQTDAGASGDVSIGSGDPPHVVCSLTQGRAADLLVIGRGSAAGVFGRLRTNAYAIIRQSPCPVVSV